MICACAGSCTDEHSAGGRGLSAGGRGLSAEGRGLSAGGRDVSAGGRGFRVGCCGHSNARESDIEVY